MEAPGISVPLSIQVSIWPCPEEAMKALDGYPHLGLALSVSSEWTPIPPVFLNYDSLPSLRAISEPI